MGLGVVWLMLQCHAKASDAVIEAACLSQGNAEVVVSLGTSRLEFDRVVEYGDRLLQAALPGQVDATTEEIIGRRVDRFATRGARERIHDLSAGAPRSVRRRVPLGRKYGCQSGG